MGKFEDLEVWRKGVELASKIYKITGQGALSKDFGLRDQIRRSAVSIGSNIAEGDELNTQKQSISHFYIAKASSAELFTQIIIAEKVGYLDSEDAASLKDECKKISSMLQRLINVRIKSI